MTDINTSIHYIEQLSDEEWYKLHNVTKSCSEVNYCLSSCSQKCAVSDFLQLLREEASRERVLGFLHNIGDNKQDELGNKPLYCMEQGFCALYCVSSCSIGTFMRALTRERALERDNASDLCSNISL